MQNHAQSLAAPPAYLFLRHVDALSLQLLHQLLQIPLATVQPLADAIQVLQYAVLHLGCSLVGKRHGQRMLVLLLRLRANHQIDILHRQGKSLTTTGRSLVYIQ